MSNPATPADNVFFRALKAEQAKRQVEEVVAFPVVAVVGDSGQGKSYSIAELPPEQTVIFNIERKPLPFKNAGNFPNVITTVNIKDFEMQFAAALASPGFTYIVLDSFAKYMELLYDLSRKINKGYDIYNWYNDKLFEFLEIVKGNRKKFVILFCIPEVVKIAQPSGLETAFKRIATVGKKWEGKIEKEFSVVLFADVTKPDKDRPAQYRFLTNTDGINSAKSPPEMFPAIIPNNLKLVCDKMTEYWNLKIS